MNQPNLDDLSKSWAPRQSDRSTDSATTSGVPAREVGVLSRVGVSLGARLYIGLIWLIVAAFPTGVVVFSIVGALQPHPGGVYSDANGTFGNGGETVAEAWITAAVLALPALVIWYFAWRQLTRSCRPEAGGLRIRGFWRTHHVSWSAVRDVRATPTIARYRFVAYSNARVVFTRPDGRGKTVQVSANWNKYLRDAILIRLWSPPGHPLRAGLPRGLRDAVSLPDLSEHSAGEIEHQPPLFAVRPAVSLRLAQAFFLGGFLLAICVGFIVWGAVVVGKSNSRLAGVVLIVIFGTSALLLVVSAARALSQRLAVYPNMITCHGLITNTHFFRDDVLEFRQHLSGVSGTVVETLLRNGTTHQLSPTAAWGMQGGDKTLEQLRAWAAG